MTGRRERRRSKAEREFVSEAEEILEAMRGGIADLSDRLGTQGEVDPDLVNALFRSAHSLKALAGMFRFESIQGLAHRLEDVLDGLRLGRVPLGGPLLALIEETVALFGSLLEQVGNTEAIADATGSIDRLAARIQAAVTGPPAASDDFAGLDVDPSLLRALTEYEEHRLRENIRRGRHVALVDALFDITAFEEGLSELSSAVRENGEVLSTLPAAGDTAESQIQFSLLVASDVPALELAARLDFPHATTRAVLVGRTAPLVADAQPARREAAAQRGEAERSVGPRDGMAGEQRWAPAWETADADDEEVSGSSGAGDAEGSAASSELESLKSISDTVRVDIRKLDELMNLVGELVIQRGAIGELLAHLDESAETARLGRELSKVYKSLDRKLRELQSAVLEVRMVPLRQVLEKVSRVVRRTRRDLGKDVVLEIRGADTELDKLIVEGLVDPLMHVVRNALDHGIERPEERRAAGKERDGRISIEALQRGNHVVIAVRDDGRGIDAVRLRAKAERLGLVSTAQTLSDKETLELIFAPGTSTRDEVTETSGRGVGMDVVRANLTALGGVVDVESTPGLGTTIAMTLPITLAIIQSLIVGVRDQRFAIPLNAVLETLLIGRDDVQVSEGRELLNLRGDPLVLRRLADEFALEAGRAAERPYVVVLGIGDQRVGLVVDRIEGQQDTVIKPIQGPIQNVRGIAGATELGDQDPVLVLDVSALVEDAVRRRDAA